MHVCGSRVSEACPSGCVLRLVGYEAAACVVRGLPGGARTLRDRGQENKAHEMKARVRPSGIATTRAMPAPPSGRATRSAAAGPIAAISRTPSGDGLALHHSLSKRCRSPRRLRDKGARRLQHQGGSLFSSTTQARWSSLPAPP